jgi:hypothetical protein
MPYSMPLVRFAVSALRSAVSISQVNQGLVRVDLKAATHLAQLHHSSINSVLPGLPVPHAHMQWTDGVQPECSVQDPTTCTLNAARGIMSGAAAHDMLTANT